MFLFKDRFMLKQPIITFKQYTCRYLVLVHAYTFMHSSIFKTNLRFMYWQSIYMFIFWITRLITVCYICLFMHSVNSNILREVIFLTDEETLIPVTLWVVCDVETPEGRELLYSAIRQLVSLSYCVYCL